jgi:two-component system OmpR family response regulator
VSPAVAALRRRGGVRHLLVVDDEPEAAGEIAAYLARQGWRVTVAEGGNAAWRAFQSDPADAVITDLRMPDGDGWTLIRQLRDHAPALPILAVTATHGEEARKAVKCGAAVVLTKPVGLEEIAEELNEVSANITETGTGE